MSEYPPDPNVKGLLSETQRSWQEELAAGRVDAALTGQLSSEDPDAQISEALQTLSDVQRHLRAKRWYDAKRVLDSLEEPPAIVDWQQLREQLDALEQSSELLDRRLIDDANTLLEGIDAAALQAEADTQRGTARIFEQNLETASNYFHQALDKDPKHYRALTNQGNIALEQGDIDGAIGAYEAALKINEEFANAHHNLGVAYRRKGEISKSVQSIKRAQRAGRRQEADEARKTLKSFGQDRGSKLVKWLLYGVGAVVLYFILQSQGII